MGDSLDEAEAKPRKVPAKAAKPAKQVQQAPKHLNQKHTSPTQTSSKPAAPFKPKSAKPAQHVASQPAKKVAPKNIKSEIKRETIIDRDQDLSANGQWMDEDEMEEENAAEEFEEQSDRRPNEASQLRQQKF